MVDPGQVTPFPSFQFQIILSRNVNVLHILCIPHMQDKPIKIMKNSETRNDMTETLYV